MSPIHRRLNQKQIVQLNSFRAVASFHSLAGSCVFHQNTSHGNGGNGQKMSAIFPVGCCVEHFEIRLVNQGRSLKRMFGALPPHIVHRQRTKLLVHQGHKLVHGIGVARAAGMQQPGYL
jgi:hypothetical protein